MNNTIKKLILFILTCIVVAIGINIYTSVTNKDNKDYQSDIINKSNAKTLDIYNHKVTNLSERTKNDTIMVKMKNTSDFNVSQIVVYYEELDKNGKIISDSKMNLDITLSPEDVIQIQVTPKQYTSTIEITGYKYIVEDCSVNVNLKENDVKIDENIEYLENSKNYEVMSINKNQSSENNSTFTVKIKNISEKNLGNIILKIAETDENGEIVKVDHIIYNSILKPEEEGEITTPLYNSDYDVKILGYTYDDMESKSNIDIDLITHKVNIVDNKQ